MITLNKTDFLNGIKAVKSSCGKTNINPILGTLHLKTIGQGLQITATNTIFSARIIIEANVTEQCDFCINADKLENIVSALDDIITIDYPKAKETAVAVIKSGKTHFDILTLNSIDYPSIEFELSEDTVTLSKEDFVKGVNKTIISTTIDNQSILNGVCFTFNNENGYEMAATDGNRLSVIKFNDSEVAKEGQYIIPHNVLNNVIKSIEEHVDIYFKEKKVIFKTGNCLYSTQLLAGTYPAYNKLIPDKLSLKATVNRNDLLKALEKVAIMSDARTNITVFDFKNNELNLTTSCENGKAKDTIEVNFEGEFKIAFNFRFVLEGIKAMQSEIVEFGMNTASSATVLNGDFCYLIMPIMLKRG